MEFFGAFLVCGLICVMAQLLCEVLPHTYGPTLFLLVIVLGALLAPVGVMPALTELGHAGIVITVFNVGAAVCENVVAIAGGASPIPLISVLGCFLAAAILGIIAGAVYVRRNNIQMKPDEQEETAQAK